VPAAALAHVARADGFGCFGLSRRDALWAVEGLADTALPLFAAADAATRPLAESVEPAVALPAMTEGGEVVADYRAVGLSLRRHPLAFLRGELDRRGMVRCASLAQTKDGRRVIVPGIVLVRQKPGSAKGVMFITLEDETGIANIIVWPSIFEAQRRLILSASMIGVRGRVQREGGVVHVITETLIDLSDLLRSVGERSDDGFSWPTGRGDEARHGGAPDQRETKVVRPRDLYCPTVDTRGIKVPTRDFR
jgi:error-prone DNA polymerase